MTGGVSEAAGEPTARAERGIRRVRGLPGGRAVVGALLISAAAVGVFASFLAATAEPGTRYVVAAADIDMGTRIDGDGAAAELFELIAIELPPDVAGRAVSEHQAPQLTGQLVTSPVREGDLLLASALVDDHGVPATEKLSFSLPAADAVGGSLEPGERIDILATYGSGADAWTSFVVRGVLLVDHHGAGGGVGAGEDVTLTVAVSSLRDVQALGHAVRTADVFATRSTVQEGARDPAPDAYTPSREAPGPAPDPGGVSQGPGDADRGDTADVEEDG